MAGLRPQIVAIAKKSPCPCRQMWNDFRPLSVIELRTGDGGRRDSRHVARKQNSLPAFRRIDGPGIDALVVPGGNFPTMDWIAAWERQFGKPVITTNQATLWAMLQTMKVDTPLPGKGRLLEQLPAG